MATSNKEQAPDIGYLATIAVPKLPSIFGG